MSELRHAIWKIYSVSRNSWGGRTLFLLHLLFMIMVLKQRDIGMITWPTLALTLIDLPQLTVLCLIGVTPAHTPLATALLGLFISIPWWAYDVAAEFAVRRLAKLNHRS